MIDAAGHEIKVGDRVGGTTSGRYQETIIGEIVKIGTRLLTIEVESSSRPGILEWKRISPGRVFLIT
jgi:hypothetical protein